MKGKYYNPNTGKYVSGAAAQQMFIKHNGGWDEHHQKFAEAVAKEVTQAYLAHLEQDVRKTAIHRVK